jgi:dTDP-4-amino-4,6-dideoxygalactose transaminase
MIPLFKTAMSPNAALDVARVLNSGYVGQGNKVEWFETALREHFNYPSIVTTNSATSAIHLALHMLKLPMGTQVLTTPLTCTATNWPIRANGLTPVWVDVNPGTLNICLQDVSSKLTELTQVLMLVHWGGYPIDLAQIEHIKQEYRNKYNKRLHVIEDCAHAWGAKYKGQPVGTHGNLSVFSFGPIKPLSCGDGGVLLCRSEEETERARLLRWYGIDRDNRNCDIEEWGFKFHMNDINASIGLANLEMSKKLVYGHRRHSLIYDVQLQGIPGVKLLERNPSHESSCWLYTMLVERRGEFILKMMEHGIEARPVHKRNDQYTCVDYLKLDLPRLDSIYSNIVCIPNGWWLTEDDRNHIINTIRSGW